MSKFDKRTFGQAFVVYVAVLAVGCLGSAWIREENTPVNDGTPSAVKMAPAGKLERVR